MRIAVSVGAARTPLCRRAATAQIRQSSTVRGMTTKDDEGQQSLTDLACEVDSAVDALTRLAAVRRLNHRLTDVVEDSVRSARSSGVPWRVIGEHLGVTKQAVAKRFARTEPPHHSAGGGESVGTSQGGDAANTAQANETPVAAPNVGRRSRRGWQVRTPAGRVLLRIERDR